jgi:hypothetical protein
MSIRYQRATFGPINGHVLHAEKRQSQEIGAKALI